MGRAEARVLRAPAPGRGRAANPGSATTGQPRAGRGRACGPATVGGAAGAAAQASCLLPPTAHPLHADAPCHSRAFGPEHRERQRAACRLAVAVQPQVAGVCCTAVLAWGLRPSLPCLAAPLGVSQRRDAPSCSSPPPVRVHFLWLARCLAALSVACALIPPLPPPPPPPPPAWWPADGAGQAV